MPTEFAVDPYYFNQSRHFDKKEFIQRDLETLSNFFKIDVQKISEVSNSYVGNEERLFNFINAIRFWSNAVDQQLTDDATTLSALVSVFAIEAIVGNQIPGKEDRFRSFLHNFLEIDEKIELVSNYTFGTPYLIGNGLFRKKHLCHRAVILSFEGSHYNRSYCSSGENPICYCREWLNSASQRKVNKYMNMLATHLYQMRSSVVHDASSVRFTSLPYFDDHAGHIVPTTADAYSDNRQHSYTSYDTDMTMSRYHELLKNAAWRCYEKGSRVRKIKKVPLLKRL